MSTVRFRRSTIIHALLLLLAVGPSVQVASGQSLLSRFRMLRTREIAQEYFSRNGLYLDALPLEPLGVKSDSIRSWILSMRIDTTRAEHVGRATYEIDTVRTIQSGEIEAVRNVFEKTYWAFLGNSSFFNLDSMLTREIRARLEFHFGPPTRTLLERGAYQVSDSTDSIQFEYWFILNDTIPAFILDTNGPWDRGIVMAAPSAYRSILIEIKESLLRQLVESDNRRPFADYYFNHQQGVWYVTGFDGASYFDVRIDRPDPSSERPQLSDYGIRYQEPPR